MDENCLVFDTDEENKFSYTDIHNVDIHFSVLLNFKKAFKTTIEEILEGFISDIGVNE